MLDEGREGVLHNTAVARRMQAIEMGRDVSIFCMRCAVQVIMQDALCRFLKYELGVI